MRYTIPGFFLKIWRVFGCPQSNSMCSRSDEDLKDRARPVSVYI